MVRIKVEPADTFARLGEKVCYPLCFDTLVLTKVSFQEYCLPLSISAP